MKGDGGLGLFGKEEGRDGLEVGGMGENERDTVIFQSYVCRSYLEIYVGDGYDNDDLYYRVSPGGEERKRSQQFAVLPRKLVQKQEGDRMLRGLGRGREESQKWSNPLTCWGILSTK